MRIKKCSLKGKETLIRVETTATSQNMEYAKITQLSTVNKVMTNSKENLKKSELETDGISGNFPFSDMVQISKAAEKGKCDSHNGLGDKLVDLGSIWDPLILLKFKIFC